LNPPSLFISELTLERQNKVLLEKTSLTLESGKAAVLSGSNGCGKTTLLRSITGLYPQKSGMIQVNGMDTAGRVWRKFRHTLAYVSQEQTSRTFPVTVREMVESGLAGISSGRKARDKVIVQSLEDTGCLELIDRSYFTLSGGERQRVALARCLSQDARLLVLDEPLTYLDKEGRARFSSVLENIRIQYGISILLVTHTDDDFTGYDWARIVFQNRKLEVLK